MSQDPSIRPPTTTTTTKLKIPRAAASYTPATMDPDLRSQLNMLLINGGHDKKIQEHLLYTLNAHPNNWPTQVQSRALALLRSGEATTFPVLLKQILDEVRRETSLQPRSNTSSSASASSTSSNNNNNNNNNNNATAAGSTSNGAESANGSNGASSVQVNGSGGTGRNGSHRGPGPGEASNLNRDTPSSLAVPKAVVDEALKVTSQALREVAEFEEENGAT
ncbi:hypothetical protein VPNG_00743 [Cytospora leucostoma]|uniref:Uncharacterized protein n=1 Tax=Cytospora leucostoma TaxID=1230097 RepID=A0A423XMY1_9PEZI|nr:hypothetical protein VPNG_00743 [Cytospora leucostoma]